MTQEQSPIHLLVVDDDSFVIDYLSKIVDTADDIDIVATASTADYAFKIASSTKVDVVLTDIHLPGIDGITLTELLLTLPNPPRVVAMTSFDNQDTMMKVLGKGAHAYVAKVVRPEFLIETIRHAAAGKHTALSIPAPAKTNEKPKLTQTNNDVLMLLCRGSSNAEIASKLSLSESAIKKHISTLLRKCNAESRVELAVIALRSGWID